MKLNYYGFFCSGALLASRVGSLAAINKMKYVAESLEEIGYSVDIISISWLGSGQDKLYEGAVEDKLSESIRVKYFPSLGSRGRISKFIKIFFFLLCVFLHLVFKVKKGEVVLLYHVPWASLPFRMAKRIKKFKLILEVEELYYDVGSRFPAFVTWEKKLLCAADAYLLSTDYLSCRLPKKIPSVVCHGSYKVASSPVDKFSDGKVHLVYAGVIDSHKKGAYNALEAAKLLPKNYHLHILGFGEIGNIKEMIKEHMLQGDGCSVSYDGILAGNEFLEFCKSCDIGLSTQTMSGAYLESSFPSKVMTYLNCGLSVVSGRVSCVEDSEVAELIYFYDNDCPESIALAIKKVSTHDASLVLRKMEDIHKEFNLRLKDLVTNLHTSSF